MQCSDSTALRICVNARYCKSVACLVIEIITHAADCVEVKQKQSNRYTYKKCSAAVAERQRVLRIIECFAKSLKVV